MSAKLTEMNDALRVIFKFAKDALVHEDAIDAFTYIADVQQWAILGKEIKRGPALFKPDFDAALNAIRTITNADGAVRAFLQAAGIEPEQEARP